MTSIDQAGAVSEVAGQEADKRRSRPRLLMIVANDVAVDSRVRKSASVAVEMGLDVHILGTSSSGRREESNLDGAHLIRLPIDKALARDVTRTQPVDSSDFGIREEISLERARFALYQRDAGADLGWLRRQFFEARTTRRVSSGQPRNTSPEAESSNAALLARVRGRLRRFNRRRLTARYTRIERKLEGEFRESEAKILARLDNRYRESQARIQKLITTLSGDTAVVDRVDWRVSLPELHDLDAAFAPQIDELDADLIHVHDVHLLGVAVRAAGRAYSRRRTPRIIYDAHEYIRGLGTFRSRTVNAFAALEAEYISRADRVITVSPGIAERLHREHNLRRTPDVLLNVPGPQSPPQRTLREVVGLGRNDLLAVYSGGLDPTRGVLTLVNAIAAIEDVHLVLVTNEDSSHVRQLREMATNEGFNGRLHLAPFVPASQVVQYLSDADVAVHPMVAGPLNHRLALPNKLFDYLQAGLPTIVSRDTTMAELVTRLGVGETFESGSAESLAGALTTIISNFETYRAGFRLHREELARFRWETQRLALEAVYADLTSGA